MDQIEARRLFTYSPVDKGLVWRTAPSPGLAGRRVGALRADGYRVVRVHGVTYQERRLVWVYVKGSIPDGHVVRMIEPGDDSRIENLRLAQDPRSRPRVPGVTLHVASDTWRVMGSRPGRKHRVLVGYFPGYTEAVAAAKAYTLGSGPVEAQGFVWEDARRKWNVIIGGNSYGLYATIDEARAIAQAVRLDLA